jgi:Flp pilus assembly protein CpaB
VVTSGRQDQPETRARVLLSPVRVLAVLAPDDAQADRKLLVTLAVRPEQAPLLAQAAQGTVDLVLLPQGGG